MLPFQNLSGDARLDWISRGLSESLVLQLTGSGIDPAAFPSLREAISSGANGIVEGYFSTSGGRLRVRAVVENTAIHRIEKQASAMGADPVAVADSIAHQIDPGARPPLTRSAAALEALIEAISESADARGSGQSAIDAANRDFERAVNADPAFGAAYQAWIETLLARGDAAGAHRVLNLAARQSGNFQPMERERLALAAAVIGGDRAAERRALEALTHLTPADAGIFRQLAEIDVAEHAYANAIARYRQALERAPEDIVLLNQLGYAQSYALDLQGAAATLDRYRALHPQDPNPLDSLGDVHYYLGSFKDAARDYREAYDKDPAFLGGGELYKAAWACLMDGDAKSAGELFSQYIVMRQNLHDPSVPYRQAQWDFLTGRRKQAIASLTDFVRTAQGSAAGIAASQLAVWNLETGNLPQARAWMARTASSGGLAPLLRFLTEPPALASAQPRLPFPPLAERQPSTESGNVPASPSQDCVARAARAFPGQPELQDIAVSHALLFAKEFAAAVPPLTRFNDRTPASSPNPVNTLLAWALVESGDFAPARALLRINAIPDPSGEYPFLSLSFPRVFYLRAMVAANQGRHEDARRNYKLFLQYSGDVPTIFGEERRARAALGE